MNLKGIIYKKFYPCSDEKIDDLCKLIKPAKTRSKNKVDYYDIPVALDIETSSIQINEKEFHSFMWIWQFGIGIDDTNYIMYGRTWEEFEKLLMRISYQCQLGKEKKLVCFVHNLSYEFSFLGRRLEWDKVFNMKPHKPLFAKSENGFEFRCSYLLSGLSLANVGKGLTDYPATKRVGDLDYSKIRSSATPVDKTELLYCIDDIHVLLNYIREEIDKNNGITRIPYTKTGYARIHTKRHCFGRSHKKGEGNRTYESYKKLMHELVMDYYAYTQAKNCYTGGFTHANAHYVDKILYDMGAKDITSSYPTQLCANMMPMSAPTLDRKIKSEDDPEFKKHLKEDCCIFYMWVYDLEPIIEYENLISSSRLFLKEGYIENNGRIVSAKKGYVAITEIDYELMKKCYKWSHSEIFGFRYMKKGYLPKNFIISILTLYKDKTQLKGVEGKEAFYMQKKSILNSVYGMTVTSPVKQMIEFINTLDCADWKVDESKSEEELLEKYNNDKNRFIFYYWGIWCCKYAMKQLWDAIFELKNDYVYTDTDSVKYRHPEKHEAFFERYNSMIQKKLEIMCDFYSLPYGYIRPTDKKGKEQPLGVWDTEAGGDKPLYKIFKTLGAKRYIYLQYGEIHMTTAGVRKEAIDYLQKTYGRIGFFEHFKTDLYVPPEESGKLAAYYIDEEIEGDAVDYLGNPFHYHEMSCVTLVDTEYNLSRGKKFVEYLEGFRSYDECI